MLLPDSDGEWQSDVTEGDSAESEGAFDGDRSHESRRDWFPRRSFRAGVMAASSMASLFLFFLVFGRTVGSQGPSSSVSAAMAGLAETLEKSSIQSPRLLDEDHCDTFDHIKLVKLIHNNLANKGPQEGPEGMIYLAKDLISHGHVYVQINAMSEYTPFSAKMNGWDGPFGCINLQAGSSVDLRVRLYKDAEGKVPLRLMELPFTFVDLDGDIGNTSREFVASSGYKFALLEDSTQVKRVAKEGERTSFHATERGIGADNPKDPYHLTQLQKDRSVNFFYQNVHEFSFTIGASKGQAPRFMTFVGLPLLLCSDTTDIGDQPDPVHSNESLPDLTFDKETQAPVLWTGANHAFKNWFVRKGEAVHSGTWIARTRDYTTGRMDIIKSKVRGTMADLQALNPGDLVSDKVPNKVMAVIQISRKLQPLPFDPNFENPIRSPPVPGYIFVRWLVKVGDNVGFNDEVAVVYTPENQRELILARCYGKVKALQPLAKWENINLLVDNFLIGVITRSSTVTHTTSTSTVTTSTSSTSTTLTSSTSTTSTTRTSSTSTTSTTTHTSTTTPTWTTTTQTSTTSSTSTTTSSTTKKSISW